jgi:3',5'-cyclic AMP phosphodiesterase CpdA
MGPLNRTWLAFMLAIASGCHSATVHVVRRSSGAVFGDLEFLPTRGTDLHYISFALSPFANCVDALLALSSVHHQNLTGNACDSRIDYQDYVGYGLGKPVALDDSGKACELAPPRATSSGDARAPHDRCKAARVSWAGQGDPLFQTAQRDALARILKLTGDQPPPSLEPTPIASFIHMSDVQIREHEATLGSKGLSTRLDSLIQSFQRDANQEIYSPLMYAAMVDTINAELDVDDLQRPGPSFMIHTGDAVDAGLQSEFDKFRALSDRLKIPWYQAVGNHDVLAFGNMRMIAGRSDDQQLRCDGELWTGTACTCTRVADLVRELVIGDAEPDNLGRPAELKRMSSLVPVLLKRICIVHKVEGDRFVMNPERYHDTVRAFVAAHCRDPGTRASECAPPVSSQLVTPYAEWSSKEPSMPCALQPTSDGASHSVMNGFDLRLSRAPHTSATPDRSNLSELVLAIRRNNVDDEQLGRDNAALAAFEPGYYCFETRVLNGGPRIWAVVLNTSTPNGAYGELSATELDWFKGVLDSPQIAKTDLVLVFGHHPVYDIFDLKSRDRFTELITSHDNVVAYFAGHTHAPGLRLIHPAMEGQTERVPHHVWEIVAPALISYPQQGRQVTVKTTGNVGFLEILTFAPNGEGATAGKLELAEQGALQDKCHESPGICEDGRPRLPQQQLMFSRLFFKLPGR